MKIILQLFLLTALLVSTNDAQKKETVHIDEYDSFLHKAKVKYLEQTTDGYSVKKDLDKKDIDEIKRIVFLTRRNGSPTLVNYFAKETENLQNQYEGKPKKYKQEFRFTKKRVEEKLMKLLKNSIPSLEYKLIDNYIMIKGRILSITKAHETIDPDVPMKFHINFFQIKVEDVIIGNKNIKSGDVISMYYLLNTSESIPHSYFDKLPTDSFIFRLRDKNQPEGSKFKFGLPSKAFPILDGYVYDSQEYFENGSKVEWKILQEVFAKTIKNIIE